jgi:oxaloacetate decarboxylase alpha subunit
MLLRGQNLVGYQNYPDDVAESFIKKSAENGIDIFRIFDALNDVRNIEFPLKVVKSVGAHAQATVSYTVSPVHTNQHYLDTALALQEMGADSLCIKDMAGLLTPFEAQKLITLLKENLDIPIQLHSHYVGGMAVISYVKAVEAGVDAVDTCAAPIAFGVSQPPVETLVRILKDTKWDPGLDLDRLFYIAKYFEEVRKKRGFERAVTRISDMEVFSHQVPGGMITNLVSQLRQQKAIDRIDEVLKEIPRVREDLGYPPLVTPTSQIVGTQAVLNVLMGERYKIVPGEVKAYVKGYYGRPPAPIKEEIVKLIIGDEEPIKCRPADLLEPFMEKARKETEGIAESEEDVISYAMFPNVALKFFERRKQGLTGIYKNDEKDTQEGDGEMNLKDIAELIKIVNETKITEVNLEGDGVKINLKKGGVLDNPNTETEVKSQPVKQETKPAECCNEVEEVKAEEVSQNKETINAPMVGTFYRAPSPEAAPYVAEGDVVEEGQVLCIIEAMKLMNEIQAEKKVKILKVLVDDGQPVEYGQPLFEVEEV